MAEAQGLRKQDRVVRPITAAGGRTCARPGCPALARSTLSFAYDAKQARLLALTPERDPAAYDLCTAHADRTSPPFGWTLSDERPPEDDGGPVNLADEDRTVAVISAALRAVPSMPEPAAQVAPEPEAEVGEAEAAEAAVVGASVTTVVAEPEPDDDVLALAEAAEQIAGAEVEVALAELSELDAVAATRVTVASPPVDAVADEPAVWRGPVDTDSALTLPFGDGDDVQVGPTTAPQLVEPDDEDFDDAPYTEDGAAQLW